VVIENFVVDDQKNISSNDWKKFKKWSILMSNNKKNSIARSMVEIEPSSINDWNFLGNDHILCV
jgi:hypothetical protein